MPGSNQSKADTRLVALVNRNRRGAAELRGVLLAEGCVDGQGLPHVREAMVATGAAAEPRSASSTMASPTGGNEARERACADGRAEVAWDQDERGPRREEGCAEVAAESDRAKGEATENERRDGDATENERTDCDVDTTPPSKSMMNGCALSVMIPLVER